MAGILDLIRDWATDLAYWEQAALEKVASGATLGEKDYQDLLDLCMQDAGLIPMPTGTRPAFTFPTKLADQSELAGYRLERLFHLQNVNALPDSQELTFGDQLTAVYGPNAAGKTSYTRPLGCAAFARGEREVLTDARKSRTTALPKAEFEISKADTKKTISWTYGTRCQELAGVYVFDGTSITAHLTRPNSLSFSPAGLSRLTKLAEVTDAVRERLRKLIEVRLAPHTLSPFFPGDSAISREIGTLNAKSNVSTLEKCAALSADDENRISELDQQIADLKSRNVPHRITSLRQQVKDIEALLTHVDAAATAVGPAVNVEVKVLINDVLARREEAARVGADQFKFAQFTQTGTDVWRSFLGTAKALADAEAQRGTAYPQQGDACLFCRQTLTLESIDLINRMWKFLSSDAQAQFESAQEACQIRAKKFQTIPLTYFATDSLARRILDAEAPEAVVAIEAHILACSALIRELRQALTTATVRDFTVVTGPDIVPVQCAIDRRLKEIVDLETTDTEQELKKLQDELRELQHRRALGERLADLKVWVNGQQWAARAQKAVGSTRHITAKYNELFKLLVTDQYRHVFQATLQNLRRNLKLTIETRGQKGETVRQIVLSPDAFAQKIAIDKILSDGEKRAVALVDFLTEVSLDASSNAIILDDPVSSFDIESKEAVAKLLAENATKRQVIVFTHDLAFLHALKVWAKKLNVGVVSHWIRSEDGQPGYVYLDNSPICEGDYKSAKIARDCSEKAKHAPPAEQERLLQQGFGALRTTYEAFVIYDLFNGVVKRFEERVGFDQLKEVILDREVVEQVVEKLGTLSRHIDAHLHSDAFASDKPTPQMLVEEINAFEGLRKRHKESKKAAAATTAATTLTAAGKPAAKAAPASEKGSGSDHAQPTRRLASTELKRVTTDPNSGTIVDHPPRAG
jgi:energy-coupling factor transporter ATP-binding protein EcfA2